MQQRMQDVRYAFRKLGKAPVFTVVAVLTLALGIGAAAAIFSVVNAVLLKPMAFPQPEQLQNVYGYYPEYGRTSFSAPDFLDLRAQNQVFSSVAAWADSTATVSDTAAAEHTASAYVLGDLFGTLGAPPSLGRTFVEDEFKQNGPRVVILTQRIWQRRFARDPNILGRQVMVNAVPRTIVGIAPASITDLTKAEILLPLQVTPQQGRRSEFLNVVARAKPGVNSSQANAEVSLITERLAQQYPDTNRLFRAGVAPFHADKVAGSRTALIVLSGAVVFLLLIVCASLATLLLGRAAQRDREMAVRAALGAPRRRIIAQLITESVVLAFVGGGLGLALAYGTVGALRDAFPQVPRIENAAVDLSVLLFAIAVSVVAGITFGLAPALIITHGNVNSALRESGATATQTGSRQRVRRILVVTQIAVSLVLLIGAALLVRSFTQLLAVDPGFRPMSRLTFRVTLPPAKYKGAAVLPVYDRLLNSIAATPNVKSVGAISEIYLRESPNILSLTIEGIPDDPNKINDAHMRIVTPTFFRTIGVSLFAGRWFEARDDEKASNVVLVNKAFADRFLAGQDPIGRRLSFSNDDDNKPQWREIVGVVSNTRQEALEAAPYPEMTVPLAQYPQGTMTFVVETANDPLSVAGAIRGYVQEIDRDVPVYALESLEQVLSDSVNNRRFAVYALGLFAGVAVLLALIGIYGVLASGVAARTGEIGIRMALGAQAKDILLMFLTEGGRLAAIGIVLGALGALALARTLATLLFGIRATDALTYAVVSLALLAVALLASFIPARRATKVEPMIALRCE